MFISVCWFIRVNFCQNIVHDLIENVASKVIQFDLAAYTPN
jgi:hypothetical protein